MGCKKLLEAQIYLKKKRGGGGRKLHRITYDNEKSVHMQWEIS